MNNFQKEFVMNMFLDNDNVCTINRLVVAVANIVNENNENMTMFGNVMMQEFKQSSQVNMNICPGSVPLTRRIKGFYEQTVRNFTDEEYAAKFKMKSSTVQVYLTSVYFSRHFLLICYGSIACRTLAA